MVSLNAFDSCWNHLTVRHTRVYSQPSFLQNTHQFICKPICRYCSDWDGFWALNCSVLTYWFSRNTSRATIASIDNFIHTCVFKVSSICMQTLIWKHLVSTVALRYSFSIIVVHTMHANYFILSHRLQALRCLETRVWKQILFSSQISWLGCLHTRVYISYPLDAVFTLY
jgi:hypothetical protein